MQKGVGTPSWFSPSMECGRRLVFPRFLDHYFVSVVFHALQAGVHNRGEVALCRYLRRTFPRLTLSELFDDVPPGAYRQDVQCQDVQRLTYASGAFDLVTSTEVFVGAGDEERVRDTVDAGYAAKRRRFLAEQGYAYRIVDAAAREVLLAPLLERPDLIADRRLGHPQLVGRGGEMLVAGGRFEDSNGGQGRQASHGGLYKHRLWDLSRVQLA